LTASRQPRLAVDNVSISYGGPDVVRNVGFEVPAGEISVLLGPNGAGKTTLLRAISGLARVSRGRTRLNGIRIDRLQPYRIVAMGIAHVPQGREVFPYSTGFENLRAGGFIRKDRAELDRDIDSFIKQWPPAAAVVNRLGVLMSGGEQQVIAIGRALMSRPTVLLLDEPSLGLAPRLVTQLFTIIRSVVQELSQEGTAVLLVEQNIRKALEIGDRVNVLSAGELVHQCRASEITPERVVSLYMGSSVQ